MSKRSKKIMPVTDVAADSPLAAANEVQEHEEAVAQPAIDVVASSQDTALSNEDTPDGSHDDKPTGVSPFVNPMLKKSLTPEQQEKVDNYDRVSDENAKLVAENSELKDKIAEYITELDALRSKPDDSVKVKELESKLSEAEKKISELEREVKSLQDTNDKYLMKISDLTFENAKLTAEAQNREPVDMTPVPVSPAPTSTTAEPPKRPAAYRNVYRTAMNGYADWN